MNTLDEEKHVDRLCGFIFLCNGKTKPECYMYRVFGLPEFRKDVVENIKPGMQLFLFDFEVKLLYGVYEATSVGEMNVEPTAFGGKFPAQVSFRICKDCFPLPESSFKHAIKENYEKGKFKQELNDQQVRSLLSLFRPFTLPTSVPGPLSLPIKPRPETFPPPGIDNLYQARPILLSQNDPSATVVQLGHNLSVQMPQHLQRLEGPQHAYYGSSANVHPSVNKQTLPAPTMPYMENPYAARMQHVRASRVLENTYFDQSALSPEPGSYGTMVNTGYVHHVTGLQPLQVPAASHHYADAQTMANAGYVHHSTELQPLQVPAASHHYAETQTMANAGYVHHSSEAMSTILPSYNLYKFQLPHIIMRRLKPWRMQAMSTILQRYKLYKFQPPHIILQILNRLTPQGIHPTEMVLEWRLLIVINTLAWEMCIIIYHYKGIKILLFIQKMLYRIPVYGGLRKMVFRTILHTSLQQNMFYNICILIPIISTCSG
ncbi:uncharacterized protein [Euphorbia lathyris]|uniref:uncharacterized protein isoform X2 n=1 Tax=Euphorbia lathyris TaxID=212925 RepID=UPI0033137799